MIMIGFAGVVYSLFSIFSHLNQYQRSAERYENLRSIYEDSNQENGYGENGTHQDEQIKNHQELSRINEDYVGWIDISGTTISYPIVQGDDNDFYLTHNFFKESDFVGAIFMDYQNSTEKLDKNTIIYGHHMKNKSMFGSLEEYLDQGFYERNKIITLDFPDNRTYEWEIFSVYSTTDVDWMKTDFANDAEFAHNLEVSEEKSVINTHTSIGEEDRILTLSTCTVEDNEERIIVHAKLLEKGKSTENEI